MEKLFSRRFQFFYFCKRLSSSQILILLIKKIYILVADEIVMLESAAKCFWNVHQFVDDCFYFVFIPHFVKSFGKKFKRVMRLYIQSALHQFSKRVASCYRAAR